MGLRLAPLPLELPVVGVTALLFCDRGIAVSRETVRRALHRLGFVWHRSRPVPPPPDPEQKRQRLQAILEVLLCASSRGEGFFFQDETKLELNPRVFT